MEYLKTGAKLALHNTLLALSRAIVARYRPEIIVVTGNVGKTSTKDAIASVLSAHLDVRKTEKSYNSDLGLPLTIIGVPNPWGSILGWIKVLLEGVHLLIFRVEYPKWLVLEVGADKPGDIQKMVSWLKPKITVVTGMGAIPVHVEFFASPEELVKEKTTAVRAVRRGGTAVLNRDSELVWDMRSATNEKIFSYGFHEEALLRASNMHITYREYDGMRLPDGMTFKVDYDGKSVPIRTVGVLGRGHVYAMLGACAVAVELGFNLIDISEAVGVYENAPGRMRLVRGIKQTMIIDDTYNSSPIAAEAAIEVLGNIEYVGRRIAVLGDMMELGKYTIEAHETLGEDLVGKVDYLVCVGPRAHSIADGAIRSGFAEEAITLFANSSEAGVFLQNFIEAGDIILIKGSQSTRMERAVEEIMLEPELADSLLCRQDPEWKRR